MARTPDSACDEGHAAPSEDEGPTAAAIAADLQGLEALGLIERVASPSAALDALRAEVAGLWEQVRDLQAAQAALIDRLIEAGIEVGAV